MKEILKLFRDYCLIHRLGPCEIFEESLFLSQNEKNRLLTFENKYKGKRCFVVGNGPSLNKTPLHLIKDEITFAFNGIYKNNFDFKPTFLMATDYRVFKQFSPEFSSFYTDSAFFPYSFKSNIKYSESNYFFKVNRGFHLDKSQNYHFPRFSSDPLTRIYEAPSVIFYCLQLILFMGFDKVYLLGVDFNYSGNTHFDSNYKENCQSWNKPDDILLSQCFELAKLIFEQNDKMIIDLTIDGKLKVFQKGLISEVL
ncbi:6-hydroxymethylpterin diphosphokinase MptE-like protein [Aliivibrio fischeri]|uniref:6-hydroxymethylpterin diphosphokinase MptE-like protein n=1 Tax=Aliivibrio fischeri TaxID=668 RepID=UPI0007C5C1EC|nr:6-hydroxymethylpterin diphosphokinase MptE-like protein [Aliivibrio fischeri]